MPRGKNFYKQDGAPWKVHHWLQLLQIMQLMHMPSYQLCMSKHMWLNLEKQQVLEHGVSGREGG